MEKSALLRQWYTRVWEEGDLDAIDELFRPDTTAGGMIPGESVGAEEFKIMVTALRDLVGPPTITINHTVEQGDWLAAVIAVAATSEMTGAPVQATGMVFARFDADKMVEAYNCFDFVSFFEQLDLFPPSTIEMCLSGMRIGS